MNDKDIQMLLIGIGIRLFAAVVLALATVFSENNNGKDT